MNERIPVTNNTKMPIYVAGCMIPAGETRHFDAAHVPAHLRPAPAEAEPELPGDPLAELNGKNVAAIAAAVPDLSDADLDRLGELEQTKGDKARKGVLAAIAEETLKRAGTKV